jgi:hypothetical protein
MGRFVKWVPKLALHLAVHRAHRRSGQMVSSIHHLLAIHCPNMPLKQ